MSEKRIEQITLVELRAKRGKLTQKQLGDIVGTTQANISRWEQDITNASPKKLKKACEYFGVTATQLYGF